MASTWPTQTQNRRIGDLILWEPHPGYTRVSAFIKNLGGTNADITDPVGYPVKTDGSGGYALAYAGDEASVIGLIIFMHELVIAATSGVSVVPVPVLVRGEALINPAIIVAADVAGSSFNNTTIQTALKGLSPPIEMMTAPAIVATQTS